MRVPGAAGGRLSISGQYGKTTGPKLEWQEEEEEPIHPAVNVDVKIPDREN